MKKFTEGSYCDVRGWEDALIKKAAEMMAEDLGKEIWEYGRSLVVTDLAHYLYLPTPEFAVGVYGPSALGYFGTMNNVTKKEVEQMIKEREEGVLPLEMSEKGLGTIGFPSGASISFKEATAPGERFSGTPGTATNTLTLLRKAQEALLQAEENYTNASEELDTAEEAHTEALEAFRKEAVGLLGESFKTPSASSQEDMDDIENWKVGDFLLCVSPDAHDTITEGNIYIYEGESTLVTGMARVVNDKGRKVGYSVGVCLEWHSRPSKD